MRDFTPVEQREAEEFVATPYLDDSPPWWSALLLPPLVVFLTVACTALTIWDWLRKLLR